MPKQRSRQMSRDYEVGYRRPPKQYQFKAGHIANPKGVNRKPPPSPDFKASLERELAKPIRIKQGKRTLTITQEAAGTSVLVRQYVKGDPRARRDLIHLCEKYDVTLSTRDALEGALADALSAEDHALLADFVRRHGGQYPVGADGSTSGPTTDETATAPSENSTALPNEQQEKDR